MFSSLVSFARRDILETIPGLQTSDYFLPASQGSIPSILLVNDSHYYKPDIEGRQDMVFVPSEQIVRSLVHMHITSQLAYAPDQHPAIFCVPNESVSVESLTMPHYKELIDRTKAAQRKWFVTLVRIADDDWQTLRRHGMISNIQRTAARELGLQREWLMEIEDETEKQGCPFCGTELLNPTAPICPSCGKVHNPARMAELEKMLGLNTPVTPVVKK